MRILSVVGTRPQLVKAAALAPRLRARHEEVFVDTGQHWDDRLAGDFFRELNLPRPDHSLGIGGGTHAEQTGRMLLALEPILTAVAPDVVLVYGDTNSTLAGALVAAKAGVPLAHVEAGLRSFDRRMPEELNRIVVDHLSTLLFVPNERAVRNLEAEGIERGVLVVGDVMRDLAAMIAPTVREPGCLDEVASSLGAAGTSETLEPGSYIFATIHRSENRTAQAVTAWTVLLSRIASPDRPVVLAIHPGTRAALEASGARLDPAVVVVEPLGYRSSLTLQLHAAAVVTDSGGIQREASWLRVPCLVLRSSTEWTDLADASAGGTVVIGLEADQAERCLARLAPRDRARELAEERARSLALAPSGAVDRIAEALEDAT